MLGNACFLDFSCLSPDVISVLGQHEVLSQHSCFTGREFPVLFCLRREMLLGVGSSSPIALLKVVCWQRPLRQVTAA